MAGGDGVDAGGLSPIGRDTLLIEQRIILSLDVAVDTAKVVLDATLFVVLRVEMEVVVLHPIDVTVPPLGLEVIVKLMSTSAPGTQTTASNCVLTLTGVTDVLAILDTPSIVMEEPAEITMNVLAMVEEDPVPTIVEILLALLSAPVALDGAWTVTDAVAMMIMNAPMVRHSVHRTVRILQAPILVAAELGTDWAVMVEAAVTSMNALKGLISVHTTARTQLEAIHAAVGLGIGCPQMDVLAMTLMSVLKE